MVPSWHVGPVAVPIHGLFVALGVLAAMVVFVAEARRRGAVNEQSAVAVAGALIGGAIGMRLSGWARHLDLAANPRPRPGMAIRIPQHPRRPVGAYLGVLIAKRIGGYRGKTGDLFAPAVALGMAIGRIGCHLTEAPGRPTELPWGVRARRHPDCPGCLAGQAMHPSFVYEIAFQLAAFAVLLWLRNRIDRPGELFVIYVAAYALFRFFVEFVRANEMVWLDLTRPQWFLLPSLAILGVRLWHGYRHGYYRPSSAIRKCAYDHAPTRPEPRRSPAGRSVATRSAATPGYPYHPGQPPGYPYYPGPRRRATRTGRRNRARGSPSAWCSPDRRRTSRSTWSWPSRPSPPPAQTPREATRCSAWPQRCWR